MAKFFNLTTYQKYWKTCLACLTRNILNLFCKICCLIVCYLSVTQLHHIPLDAGLSSIVWCSLSDPYAVMMTADGSIILLEFTLEGVEPKVKISRPQINQVSFTFCGRLMKVLFHPYHGLQFCS